MLEGMEAPIYSFLFIVSEMTKSLISLELADKASYSIFPFALYLSLLVINRMLSPKGLLFFAVVFAACPFIYKYSTSINYEELLNRSILENVPIKVSMSISLLISGLLTLPNMLLPRIFSKFPRDILQISHSISGLLLLMSGSMFIAGLYPFLGFATLPTHPWQWAGQQSALYFFLMALTLIIPATVGAMPRNGRWQFSFQAAGLGCVGAAIYLGYSFGALALQNFLFLFPSNIEIG